MAGLLWGEKLKKCLEARYEGVQKGFLSERKGKVIPLRGPKTEKAAKEAFLSALEVPNHDRERWGGGEGGREGRERERGGGRQKGGRDIERERQTHKQAGREIEVDRGIQTD